jgi:hypothetical protein
VPGCSDLPQGPSIAPGQQAGIGGLPSGYASHKIVPLLGQDNMAKQTKGSFRYLTETAQTTASSTA